MPAFSSLQTLLHHDGELVGVVIVHKRPNLSDSLAIGIKTGKPGIHVWVCYIILLGT